LSSIKRNYFLSVTRISSTFSESREQADQAEHPAERGKNSTLQNPGQTALAHHSLCPQSESPHHTAAGANAAARPIPAVHYSCCHASSHIKKFFLRVCTICYNVNAQLFFDARVVTMIQQQITPTENGLLVLAPAKINLSLLITGKRPDGFHEIETIMAKIDYYDQLFIEQGTKPGIELFCRGPHWAPHGQDNLIYKAAQLLLKTCGISPELRITLTKNIPAGSGLGSASSDAVATLIGINKFLRLAMEHADMVKLAAELGSDTAFFLGGPLAFCTGRGEKIRELAENFDFSALLIMPDISVSTTKVYANYTHDQALYERLREQINAHIEKNRIDLAARMCANMLQKSCFSLFKELAELKAKIESLGLGLVCLSGSGSSIFLILQSGELKKTIVDTLELEQKIGCKSIIACNNRW
jgi:4-diphosphocytidyl-2-C-methyl-D-erythritol kinase